LQGEAIPHPQHPKNYSFNLHLIRFSLISVNDGVGTKDTGAADWLQVSD
jgi:hypothetical protein